MTKQRTDNPGLVLLDDVDTDSFYAYHVENMNKIDAADLARQEELAQVELSIATTYAPLNGAVTSIVRDSAGRFQSVTENGVAESIGRDSFRRIATITTGTTSRSVTPTLRAERRESFSATGLW